MRVNAQWVAAVASVGALGGLFLGVGLPVLQQPEDVTPIRVNLPVADTTTGTISPSPSRPAEGADDDADDGTPGPTAGAGEEDDRDGPSRRGPVSGDGDDGSDDGEDDRETGDDD
jgi:hypothetical protein